MSSAKELLSFINRELPGGSLEEAKTEEIWSYDAGKVRLNQKKSKKGKKFGKSMKSWMFYRIKDIERDISGLKEHVARDNPGGVGFSLNLLSSYIGLIMQGMEGIEFRGSSEDDTGSL